MPRYKVTWKSTLVHEDIVDANSEEQIRQPFDTGEGDIPEDLIEAHECYCQSENEQELIGIEQVETK